MFKYLEFTLISAVCLLLGFTGAAHAASAIDPSAGAPPDVLGTIFAALTGGHYAYVASLALVALVAFVRKGLGGKVPWLHSDAGSATLVLAGTFGATLAAALAGGGPLTKAAAENALGVAFAAAGGYGAVKALVIVPLLPKLARWPLIQTIVGYLFVHKSDPGNDPGTAPVSAPAPTQGPTQ